MKLGIIVICHKNAPQVDKKEWIKFSEKSSEFEICFVNDESHHNTRKILSDFQRLHTNISTVNVRKLKPNLTAVRAGARFMVNRCLLYTSDAADD